VRLSITSASARHVRVGMVFSQPGHYVIHAWAPTDAMAVRQIIHISQANTEPTWTAVSDGATQQLVIAWIGNGLVPWSVRVARISHFTEDLQHGPQKAFGDSGSCQIDIACLTQLATPEQSTILLGASRGVFEMIVTSSDGSSGSCTGTLLNTASYPTAIAISAYHCANNLRTLTTRWFYSRSACGTGLPSSSTVQIVTPGATLWQSAALDAALLRMDIVPPAPASYAGWDASEVNATTQALAIHHPRGDVKKGSFGWIVGENVTSVPIVSLGSFPPGTFYLVDWDYGVVEPGSSGSGLFTDSSDFASLRLRATLTGGNSTCSTTTSRTYYSKLSNVYPLIRSWLTSASLPSAEILGAVVEYYHSGFDHYFVTSIADEITKLDNGTFVGWTRTGRSFSSYASSPGAVPVCRFFSTSFAPKSSHFYTSDASECQIVKANKDWQYEGLVFGVDRPDATGTCPMGTAPVYRLYNNGQGAAPNHRYTTDLDIRSQMIARGWIPEGYGSLGVIMCSPQ
jgi:hypothetical protein